MGRPRINPKGHIMDVTTEAAAGGSERLWQAVNVLGKVKDHLARVVSDGKLARRQLSELVHTPAI
jgi:hypothetical protein